MPASGLYEFQVKFTRDRETGQVIARIPALDIADYGASSQQAFQRLQRMAVFHLECLMEEGKPIPEENATGGR